MPDNDNVPFFMRDTLNAPPGPGGVALGGFAPLVAPSHAATDIVTGSKSATKPAEEPEEPYEGDYLQDNAHPGENPFMTMNRLYDERKQEVIAEEDRLAAEAKERAERIIDVDPVDLTPDKLQRSELAPWMRDETRAEHILNMMDSDADRLNVYSWLEHDISKTLGHVKKAGLPSADEVLAYENKFGMDRNLVRDILPHAKDELEARAMAKRLLDIYGGDIQAVNRSYVVNQMRGADSAYWLAARAENKAKFEAAFVSRYGDFYATLSDSPTGQAIGRFVDQQLHRIKNLAKEMVSQTESTLYHGWASAGARILGFDAFADRLDKQHEFSQRYYASERLDTGNPVTDWVMDTALIDAPNLFSQMWTYKAFGPLLGGVVREAGMWSSETSAMLDNDVPAYLAMPLGAISGHYQRVIEQKNIYPRFERLFGNITRSPAMQRPFGQFLLPGLADSTKQVPDELLQESISKITHDVAYLGTEGATADGFKERLGSGWSGPVEGAATAGVASLFLLGVGVPGAMRAHARYNTKLRMVDSAMAAAAADPERTANPASYAETAGKIMDNARTFNQDVPAEVYFSADAFDAVIPDPAERRELLTRLNATEEYSRSRATGADMSIKFNDYSTVMADHAKLAEFRKYMKVDPDGMTVGDEEKAAEVEERILKETESLVKQMDGMAETELPPELDELRADLRQLRQLSVEEADQLAAMQYSAAKVAAAEEGGTVGEWLNKVNLRVKLQGQIQSEADLDALRVKMESAFADDAARADDASAERADPSKREARADPDVAVPAVAEVDARENLAQRAPVMPEVPAQDVYIPTPAERNAATERAKELDRKRLELGGMLMDGKHLEPAQLADYGLSMWHPQSVRMRMEEMKVEAERWRNFQTNPALIARLRADSGFSMPSEVTIRKGAPPVLDDVVKASDEIGRLFDAVMENPEQNNRNYLDFQTIDEAEVRRARELTGMDISGFKSHVIDASGIHHIINRHGEGMEADPSQEPVTREDIKLIPWIVANPDSMEYADKTDAGLDGIRYEKQIGEDYIVIEELRTGRNKLAVTSMWKKKRGTGDPKPTPETTPAPKADAYYAAGSSNTTIQPQNTIVKQDENAFEQSALVDAPTREWLDAAVDTIAKDAGIDKNALHDMAQTLVAAGEDIPEARAIVDALGLDAAQDAGGAAPATEGRRVKIIFPAEAKMPPLAGRYALVELDTLQPSHTFRNYTPNPTWTPAELAQQRNYDSGAMEATRQGIELDRLNYDTLFNPATDAINGPPIITADGKVMGGNNRSHRIYNRYQADGYRDNLAAFLASDDNLTSIRPDAVDGLSRPVLVRVVDNVDAADIPGLIGALNADFTTRRDPANLAANRGMRVGARTMRALLGINDQTIAAYLDSPDKARKVLQAMVEDGALQQTDLPALYDFANSKWLGDGRTSGKAQVEQALFGAILPDSRLLDDMPDGMKKKLVRALPALLRLKREGSPELANLVKAMEWLNEFQSFKDSPEASGLKPATKMELFRKPNQADLFTGETPPEKTGPAWDMFAELQGLRTQKDVAAYFTRKADDLTGFGRGLFRQASLADPQEARAHITFYDGVTLIELVRGKADFSSIVHEMGHVYLDRLMQRVAEGKASPAGVAAFESLQKLAGGEFTVEGIEKVMRHWEAYLREGKAPSRELIGAFDTFRSWLTGVYEDIRKYLRGDELNDATRSAFDHLLASEKEIQEVREFYYDTRERLENLPIYTPSMREKIAAKRGEAESEELSQRDKVRYRAFLRAMESREPIAQKAEADVMANPVYAALADAARDGGMNEADAVDIVGPDMAAKIKRVHGDVFGGGGETAHILAGEHGFDDARAMLEEMADARKKAQAIRDRIREIMDERAGQARDWLAETEAVPGDAAYHNDKRLELLAMQLDGLRLVLNETQQKRIQSLNLKAVTDAAKSVVGRMLVRDIGQQRRYANAERRLAKEAVRAAREGNVQGAFDALEKQIFNHAITTAMFRAAERRQSFKTRTTMKKMQNALEGMQEAHRLPLQQLLDNYQVVLRPRVSEGPNGERIVDWVTPRSLRPAVNSPALALPESMRNANEFEGQPNNIADFEPDLREIIPQWIQRLEKPKDYNDYRDLTVSRLEQLRDAIDLIIDHGKGELTALRTERYKTIDEAVKGIVADLLKSPERAAMKDPDTRSGKAFNSLERFILKGVTIDSIFAVAEGNPDLGHKGELQRYVEIVRNREADGDLRKQEIFKRLEPHLNSLGKEAGAIDALIKKNGGVIDGLPFHESLKKARNKSRFTGEMIVAAALNTGTADNLYQLQNAYEWDDGNIDALRRQLTVQGWEAVEAVWREMDGLFPDMARVAFEATHQRPPKEAGQGFVTETADGQTFESKGGYYPLAYDGMITHRQGQFQDLSSAKAMAAANSVHSSNKPFSGFRIARARGDNGELVYKGAPTLALSPLARHFDQTIHFITHAQTVWELDRITVDPRFRSAFVSRNGNEKYRAVRQWVNYLANPAQGGDARTRGGMMNFLHDRYITSVLGWNIYSANKQRLGYFTALSPMSEAVTSGGNGTITSLKYIGRAMWDFGIKGNVGVVSPKFNEIKAMSKIMKARDEGGYSKEMRDSITAIKPINGELRVMGKTIPLKSFRENLFKLIQICDRATAGPLWWANYNMYMDGHVAKLDGLADDVKRQKAIDFADSIAMTQTSPFQADHSPLQRGEDTIAKFASVCISGVMQPGNGLYQSMAGAARGNVSPQQLASYMVKTYVAMSYAQMLVSTLYGLGTGDDEPWPEWYDFILAPLDNMVGWIPYVRNVASVSKYGSSGKGIPSLDAANKQIEKISWAKAMAEKGDYSGAAWQGVEVFSYGAGIPLPAAAKIYRDTTRALGIANDDKKKKSGKKGRR